MTSKDGTLPSIWLPRAGPATQTRSSWIVQTFVTKRAAISKGDDQMNLIAEIEAETKIAELGKEILTSAPVTPSAWALK